MHKKSVTIVSLAILAILLVITIGVAGCGAPKAATAQSAPGTLYILGTYGALSRGNYDGTVTIADVKKQGDFALGNFSAIDGELVGLNGKIYQIGPRGKLTEA